MKNDNVDALIEESKQAAKNDLNLSEEEISEMDSIFY